MPFHPVIEDWDTGLIAGDPLDFPGYDERRLAMAETGEAVRTGRTEHYAFIESRFEVLGGTMGAAAGEKVVRAYDRARELRLPVVVLTRTGGARLQEGMVALVQLARTAGAAHRHAQAGLLSLAVYGSPTTGGVLASYASLVDLRAVVAGAVVGFAGPRVAEGTLGIALPPGSHTAEAVYDHGLVDARLDPDDVASWVEAALGLVDRALPTRSLPAWSKPAGDGGTGGGGGAWGEVLRARAAGRPSGIDRAARLCSSWVELRGGDPTVRVGLARVAGRRCVVVATDRYCGTGRPTPAGFRLARRAVALAGRLGLPVVTLVDTPGADPSPAAEVDGIALEVARTLAEFAACPTPTVSVCVGEGGSGGALALSYADRLLMCEHAIFSVIAPEGAAAILERDVTKAAEVADRLRLTSGDMLGLGVVDEVIGEDGAALDEAVGRALDGATRGDRDRRWDAVTARWLPGSALQGGW
ncbi:MAG TPA: carboxyl transferase domain-containing protein [Acidimicrobiales bacterium]|jgi:acetyl-CoA carboxylase carboxyl transferase subunit beta|nr:carboxyl transferase domain-containing protein [Acidimicrobiales bacterium]